MRKNHAASWVSHEVPGADLIVGQYLGQNEVGVFVRGRRGELSEDVFLRLKRHEAVIRAVLGVELVEARKGSGNYCGDRVAHRFPGSRKLEANDGMASRSVSRAGGIVEEQYRRGVAQDPRRRIG